MTVRAAWLLPGGAGQPGQTREDTRLAPVGTMTPAGELTSRPGVIPGGDPFAATAAGAMSLQIGVGRAVVQGTLAQGAYPVAVDAPEVVAFTDGDALFDRIDTVVLRVYDGLFDTDGKTLAAIEVVVGTASENPVGPSVGTAALPLWNVTVPAGASAGVGGIDWNSALFDRRKHTVAVGGIVPRGALADTGAYEGEYRDLGGTLQRWNAADAVWEDYRPPVEATEVRTSGYAAASGWTVGEFHARRRNGAVSFSAYVTRSGANITTGSNINDVSLGTLPAGWRPLGTGIEALASSGYGDGAVYVNTSGVLLLRTWTPDTVIEQGHNLRVSGAFVQ
ncbi:hypothetical protein [Streptomyces griseoflavus]|uniref:hypothetical protein n=1 Tax=Streptomyces griseoflavus TaxID=35619 RepID=UPI0033E23C90